MNEAFENSGVVPESRLSPVATIAIAQLLGTSLWFSANSAAGDLKQAWGATFADIGILTDAVQLGFILATLFLAVTGLADRFAPSKIFVFSAVLGAVFNACFAWLATGVTSGAVFRFLVGMCLAGIYPIGMKLIVTWAPERTGAAMAYLIAMLTIGTALPHALRLFGAAWKWQHIILSSSVLALFGAFLIYTLGDGPYLTLRRKVAGVSAGGAMSAFASPDFRAAAFGYFGHMWEVYAFWTIVPSLVARTSVSLNVQQSNWPGLVFAIIASGAIGSVLGGRLSQGTGSARVAAVSLALSGSCCLIFALGWRVLPANALLVLFLVGERAWWPTRHNSPRSQLEVVRLTWWVALWQFRFRSASGSP